MDFVTHIIAQFLATSFIEIIAVLSSLVYVFLAAQGKKSCWYFALISTGIYTYIFIDVELYLETFLQLFYFGMAFYGILTWNKKSVYKQIKQWPVKYHVVNIIGSLFLTILLGYYFSIKVNQDYAYLDAFTTVFSLVATFMVAHKVLENWIYWIVIDAVSVVLYHLKDLNLSALNMVLFTGLAVLGYIKWKRKFKLETP